MKNFRATISYDGTDFSGVAEQLNGPDEKSIRTVVGELRPLISMVAQAEPKIIVSGRTDKGVHAREQVVSFSFDVNVDFDCDRLAYVINKKVNPEIVVHSIEPADENFHARYSAQARTYRYFIDTSPKADFTIDRYSWHINEVLDVEAMKSAAKYFVGEQDFSSVCKNDESIPHNIREVFDAQFLDDINIETPLGKRAGSLCFEITANAFCWNMVRSIVGVLVSVGKSKLSAHEMKNLLERKDRSHNCDLAPSCGLFLWKIHFEPYIK